MLLTAGDIGIAIVVTFLDRWRVGLRRRRVRCSGHRRRRGRANRTMMTTPSPAAIHPVHRRRPIGDGRVRKIRLRSIECVRIHGRQLDHASHTRYPSASSSMMLTLILVRLRRRRRPLLLLLMLMVVLVLVVLRLVLSVFVWTRIRAHCLAMSPCSADAQRPRLISRTRGWRATGRRCTLMAGSGT